MECSLPRIGRLKSTSIDSINYSYVFLIIFYCDTAKHVGIELPYDLVAIEVNKCFYVLLFFTFLRSLVFQHVSFCRIINTTDICRGV